MRKKNVTLFWAPELGVSVQRKRTMRTASDTSIATSVCIRIIIWHNDEELSIQV